MMLYALNLLDLLFTLHAVNHGGVELNPLMGCVPVMIVYKTVVVGVLCLWLHGRRERTARVGAGLLTAVFALVCGWHIYNVLGCMFGGFP